MTYNVLFPLLVGCLSLISAIVFRYIPLRKEILKFRRELIVNYLALGIYNLLLALISGFLNIDSFIVLYLLIGGSFVISIITLIPVILKIVKEAKAKKD